MEVHQDDETATLLADSALLSYLSGDFEACAKSLDGLAPLVRRADDRSAYKHNRAVSEFAVSRTSAEQLYEQLLSLEAEDANSTTAVNLCVLEAALRDDWSRVDELERDFNELYARVQDEESKYDDRVLRAMARLIVLRRHKRDGRVCAKDAVFLEDDFPHVLEIALGLESKNWKAPNDLLRIAIEAKVDAEEADDDTSRRGAVVFDTFPCDRQRARARWHYLRGEFDEAKKILLDLQKDSPKVSATGRSVDAIKTLQLLVEAEIGGTGRAVSLLTASSDKRTTSDVFNAGLLLLKTKEYRAAFDTLIRCCGEFSDRHALWTRLCECVVGMVSAHSRSETVVLPSRPLSARVVPPRPVVDAALIKKGVMCGRNALVLLERRRARDPSAAASAVHVRNLMSYLELIRGGHRAVLAHCAISVEEAEAAATPRQSALLGLSRAYAAEASARVGNPEQALEHAKAAVKLDPQNPAYRENVLVCEFALGKAKATKLTSSHNALYALVLANDADRVISS